jgi:hypothetical protein
MVDQRHLERPGNVVSKMTARSSDCARGPKPGAAGQRACHAD